jgi:hypothetical protein
MQGNLHLSPQALQPDFQTLSIMTVKKVDHEFAFKELSYDAKPNYQRMRL